MAQKGVRCRENGSTSTKLFELKIFYDQIDFGLEQRLAITKLSLSLPIHPEVQASLN